MKNILKKSLVLMVAIFLSILFVAPAMIHADTATVEIRPDYIGIGALGQTANYEAWAIDGVGGETDVTSAAGTVWTIANASIASNDGGGAFTATAQGDTYVFATFDGVTGGAGLNVWKPDLWVDVGLPGENTGFGIWADGCSGLSWSLSVTGNTTYSDSGTIPSDPWNPYINATLSAGGYTAVLEVDGVPQDTEYFSVWEHTAWMDVDPGYSGEETTITLNAENSVGGAVFFQILRYIGPEEWNWEQVDWDNTNVVGDPWSLTYTYTLDKGLYQAGFSINGRWESWQEFSIVDRGVPQPPVVAKAPPETGGPSGPAINEKPISNYDKTNSGFVTLFYNRLLNRAPEKAGLDAWVAGLTSGALTGADLVNGFVFGVECQNMISGYTNEQFITFLYETLFSRAPDTDGLNAWLARMSAGMTKEGVVNGFTHSLEFELMCKNFGIKPYVGYVEAN